MNQRLSDHIEALLFYKGEPVSVRELTHMARANEDEVNNALVTLGECLTGGLRLMRQDDMVMLATAPEYSASIESLIKEELSKDIGKAGAETLATVLYMGPITRARIDHIRGVNSTFILRALTMRGLVEKIPYPNDSRSILYRPTLALLAHMGVTDTSALPEYEAMRSSINLFEKRTVTDIGDDTPTASAESIMEEESTDAESDAYDTYDTIGE